MERSTISGNFGVECFLDEGASLDLSLALLDLGHDSVDVLQLVASFPKYFGIFENFFGRFTLDLLGDVVDVVAAVLLVQANELIKVPLAPVGETLQTTKSIMTCSFNIQNLFRQKKCKKCFVPVAKVLPSLLVLLPSVLRLRQSFSVPLSALS